MKILFLTQRFPHPLEDGGSLRTYYMLKALCSEHDVTLIAQDDPAGRGGDPHFVDDLCKVEFVPLERSASRIAGNLLRHGPQKPLFMLKNHSRVFEKRAQRLISTGAFDAVHQNHLDAAWYRLESPRPLWRVFDTHNCMHTYFGELGLQQKGLKRWLFQREAQTTRRLEAQVLAKTHLTLGCSEEDKRHFDSLKTKSHAHVVPNGVDTDYFHLAPDVLVEEGTLSFTGTMGYFPNEDGVLWFHDAIWPHLKDKGFRWWIVGGGPKSAILALHDPPRIEVTGRVPDIRPYVYRAQVYIVPLRHGGGTRLKILEAMAMGKAIVSTRKGAEGIDCEHGKNILLADDPRDFAAQIERVRDEPKLGQDLGQAARAFVVGRYDWDAIGKRLLELYRTF